MSCSTASFQGTVVTNPPLPYFRYHSEPLASGNIEASVITCQYCGKARGHIYTGPSYSRHELPPGSLCPWCIADGSVAARYEASFSDDYPLLDTGVAVDIVTEVCERMPGYTSWQQQERWLVCCEGVCAFCGDAGREEIGQPGAEGLVQRLADFVWSASTRQRLIDTYTPGGNPVIYCFDCLHCGQAYYDPDLTR